MWHSKRRGPGNSLSCLQLEDPVWQDLSVGVEFVFHFVQTLFLVSTFPPVSMKQEAKRSPGAALSLPVHPPNSRWAPPSVAHISARAGAQPCRRFGSGMQGNKSNGAIEIPLALCWCLESVIYFVVPLTEYFLNLHGNWYYIFSLILKIKKKQQQLWICFLGSYQALLVM